jgi:hypothetical protein
VAFPCLTTSLSLISGPPSTSRPMTSTTSRPAARVALERLGGRACVQGGGAGAWGGATAYSGPRLPSPTSLCSRWRLCRRAPHLLGPFALTAVPTVPGLAAWRPGGHVCRDGRVGEAIAHGCRRVPRRRSPRRPVMRRLPVFPPPCAMSVVSTAPARSRLVLRPASCACGLSKDCTEWYLFGLFGVVTYHLCRRGSPVGHMR